MKLVLGIFSFMGLFGFMQAYEPSTSIDMLNRKIRMMSPITRDISFLIADLKVDGQKIKVCEFGEGTSSRFKGYDFLYGKGLIWKRFWKILSTYSFPKWYIDFNLIEEPAAAEVEDEIALSFLLSDKKNFSFPGIGELLVSRRFSNATKEQPDKNYGISGLVMLRHHDASMSAMENIRKRYKNILVLNAATAPFVNNKYTTDILFKEKEFQDYRPKSILCRRLYSSTMAVEIKKNMPSDVYVIKPLDGFKGCGVVMVAADQLDTVLRKILIKNGRKPIAQTYHFNGYSYTDKTFSYWADYKLPYFVIEELCHSKIIEFKGKRYDPTLRVVFALQYLGQEPTIDYLAAYWKLPLKGLDDEGSLTDKYKSVGIIPIDTTDQERLEIYTGLNKLLLPLYKKMIGIVNNKTQLTIPLMI